MATYIAWPPDNARTKFPEEYWHGNPLDNYQEGIEQEQCPECDFTVQFISDRYQYENWNDHSHEMIAGILEVQRRTGDCPAHPKPNWMS
jgi:hypothetical protein